MSESQRARLRGRSRPTAECKVSIDDTRAAERELAEATTALQLLLFGGGGEELAGARERVEAAREALEACFETIVCMALPPAEFEALIDAHPARKDHPDDDAWNVDTFPRACFLACAPDVMSRSEWEEWLDVQVSDGEQAKLYNTALEANVRAPDPSVPKGSMGTLS